MYWAIMCASVEFTTLCIIMFGPFGPNILNFVWISTFLLIYVEGYISLSFYRIDFNSQLFFRIYLGFSGSLSANQCLANDVHVGAYNALFPPGFLSSWLQILAQWSLCFEEVCYDLYKSYVMF